MYHLIFCVSIIHGGTRKICIHKHRTLSFFSSIVLICLLLGLVCKGPLRHDSTPPFLLLGMSHENLAADQVMLHQPSGGANGMAADIQIMAEEIIRTRARLNDIYAEHTGQVCVACVYA